MVKRVIATVAGVALILAFGIGTVWLSGCCTYPDPSECDALRVMAERTPDVVPEAERTPDVVPEMEWRGCPDVPWDKMSSFTPPPSPTAR